MNRWTKPSLIGLLALAGLAGVTVVTGLVLEQRRLARSIDLPLQPVTLTVPTDAAALARGQYLYTSRGCADCHGPAGAGHRLVDSGGVTIAGPDITRGGSTLGYTPADWVRAVRHGVAPGGRPLRVMPSEDYNRLTDADLGALVAHLQSLPAAGGAPAVVKLPLPARVLYGWGLVDDAADRIDHSRPPEEPVPEAVSLAHGRYVAQGCVGCHGPALGGGRIPGAPPDWPAAPALSTGAAGVMGRYPDAKAFAAMLKGGRRPDGTAIAVMPFESLSRLNDVDVQALHLFLRQEARPVAGRR